MSDSSGRSALLNTLTVDVEDWFNILDSPVVPLIDEWAGLESRVRKNVDTLLRLFKNTNVRTTMFWLGWMAERNRDLVVKCREAGHEIASHGYGHVLPYKATPQEFREDLSRSKAVLEDIIGEEVRGFRAPGYGITERAPWAFEVIKEAGYEYDSSVFPTSRGHGGLSGAPARPYVINTSYGPLYEVVIPVVEWFRFRLCLFGGGYLRLSPKPIIGLGIKHLRKRSTPLVVYVHPREIDADHPRLPLSLVRRFKSYVNLRSTLPKLEWLCRNNSFCTMRELVEELFLSDSARFPALPELNARAREGMI